MGDEALGDKALGDLRDVEEGDVDALLGGSPAQAHVLQLRAAWTLAQARAGRNADPSGARAETPGVLRCAVK